MTWFADIQNSDNECLKCFLVRYLNPVSKNPSKLEIEN